VSPISRRSRADRWAAAGSSLRLGDFLGAGGGARQRPLQELGDGGEVRPQLLLDRGRAQRRRRVEERQQVDRAAAELVHLRGAADLGDPGRAAAQQLRREVAERADDPRLDQPHLPPEVGLAGLDLQRLGVAVAGRAALQHVGDEDVLAGEADLFQQLVQQLAGAADERQALTVLFGPRRLADEHQAGIGVASPEDRLGAGLVQGAAGAVLHFLEELDQLLSPLVGARAHGFSPAARRLRDSERRSCRAASRSPRRDSSERTFAPRGCRPGGETCE
jgi:hypothetical protein